MLEFPVPSRLLTSLYVIMGVWLVLFLVFVHMNIRLYPHTHNLCALFYFLIFLDRISLDIPGYPETHFLVLKLTLWTRPALPLPHSAGIKGIYHYCLVTHSFCC